MTEGTVDPIPAAVAEVIVGIDGSDNSRHALSWAISKRHRLGEVTPVTVFQPPATLELLTKPTRPRDAVAVRAAAEAGMKEAIAGADPGVAERAKVIEGHPGTGLVKAAGSADLLVVGTRGRSSLAAILLGSVSDYCATHSAVPVAVIPEDFPVDKPLSTIVVGVDGSENAEAALRWAIDHVEPDGRVIAAGALSIWGYMAEGYEPPIDLMKKNLRRSIDQSVERVIGTDYRGPEITIRIADEDARVALRDMASAEADLLVIGARGVSGVAYLILGSVSSALVHHPTVPTVLIPPVSTNPIGSRP